MSFIEYRYHTYRYSKRSLERVATIGSRGLATIWIDQPSEPNRHSTDSFAGAGAMRLVHVFKTRSFAFAAHESAALVGTADATSSFAAAKIITEPQPG
ncbi:MAG: hypothetical protein ACJ8FB_08615, partial [Sphingomicrobium sp.]